jgi:hypothetical protein
MAKPKTLQSQRERYERENSRAVSLREDNQSNAPEDNKGWLEIERWEGSVTLSRDLWMAPENGVHAL